MNILDNYEILSVLGEGTFGVVKLGKVKPTGEKVAIKVLEKKKIINKDDEIRVEREIDILKKVHHINVIKIMKIEEDQDNTYIIMEFCEKGELFNHIVEEKKLEEIEAAYFYYQLINGLECIHYNEVVHRDLKPENLLISKEYILKIIDFGLSNYFNKINLLSTPCGSPCYASPEMVSGKKYDGFLIDIWSTGIILFAMLCGYLPFEDPDNETLFKKIYQCDVEYPDDLGEDSIDLMKKILVNNPDERITIPYIKKHPFYLKGKQKFEELHPNLVKEVEKDYSNIQENIRRNNITENNKNEEKKVIKEVKINFKINNELNPVEEVSEVQNEEDNNESSQQSKRNNKKIDENRVRDNDLKETPIQNEIILKKEDIKDDKTLEKENELNNLNNLNKKEEDIVNILDNQNNNDEINYKSNSNKILTIKYNQNLPDIPNNIEHLDIEIENKNNNNINNSNNNNNNKELNNKKMNKTIEKIENEIKKIEKKINENMKNNNKQRDKYNSLTYNSKNKINIEPNKDKDNLIKKIKTTMNNKNKKKVKKDMIKNNTNVLKENHENYQDKNNINKIIKQKEKRQSKSNDKNDNNNIINDIKYITNPMSKSEIEDLKKRNYTKIEKNKNINLNIDELLEKNKYNKYNISSYSTKDDKKNNFKNIKTYIQDNNNNNNNKLDNIENYNTTNVIYKEPKYVKINLKEDDKIKKAIKEKNNNRNNGRNTISSHLKNKINKDKNIIKERNNESLKPKTIPKRKDPSLVNKRIEKSEIKHNKNYNKNMNIINKTNDLINSLNNYKLADKNANLKIDKIFNSAKNNHSLKFNPLNKIHSEEQERKNIKNANIPMYNNTINISDNNKLIDNQKILFYNNENMNINLNNNSKEDPSNSLKMYNVNVTTTNPNNYIDTISTFSNSREKMSNNNTNIQNITKIQNINSTMNNNVKLNNNDDNNLNNVQKKAKFIKISDNNINLYKQRTKNNKNKAVNNINNKHINNSELSQKIINKNLILNKVNDFYDNNFEKLNTQEGLLSDITYRSKFYQDNHNQTYYKLKNNNIMKPAPENFDVNKNKNISKERFYNRSRKDSDLMHKKNTSNLYLNTNNTNTITNTISDINDNMIMNTNALIMKSPKNKNKKREISNQIRYNIGTEKNSKNNYVNSSQDLNYLYNNKKLLNLQKRINPLTDYLNTNPNMINSNMRNNLGLYSNSVEKNRVNDNYYTTLTINNDDTSTNLYYSSHHPNNYSNNLNNKNIQRKINNYFINNNNSYENNFYNNLKNINNNPLQYNSNTKLLKKGIIENSRKDIPTQYYNNRIPINNNNYDIYENRTKPKYLSNFNLKDYYRNDTKNNQFNRTQDLYYNNTTNNLNINNIIHNNNTITNTNIKPNNYNTISLQNNEKNVDKKKLIGRITNIQENMYTNNLNPNTNDYNRIYNTINTDNQKINKISNSNNSLKHNKQIIKNNKKNQEDLLTKLTNAKNNYEKNKNKGNINNKIIQNQKLRPYKSKDYNHEIREHYLTNNSTFDNFVRFKNMNMQDYLIRNAGIETINMDTKFIFNNNNYFNNYKISE